MPRSTRSRTRGRSNTDDKIFSPLAFCNGKLPTPSGVLDIMEDPDLDEKYGKIFKKHFDTLSQQNQKYFLSLPEANPYEKAIVIKQHMDNQIKKAKGEHVKKISMIVDGVGYNRFYHGTQWRYEHPEGDAIAQAGGLRDYDLVDVVDDKYTFKEHSDRYAHMSDAYNAFDDVTEHTFQRDDSLIDSRTRRAMEFSQKHSQKSE